MDSLQPQGKVIRAPSLKRGRNEERISDRIKLEKVLGVTVSSNAALASDPGTELVAYPAGCTVVLLSTKTAQQQHIINSSRKTITSLAFSSCGRYLVTGECGHQPAVRVWDLQAETQPGPGGVPPQVPQIAEFIAHKYGVNCVAFSPSNKYVVSIGSQHDMIVNVWDWKNNIKVASNKISTKVKAVAFAENGSYFVTVGNRHVKFWYLEYGRAKYKEAVPLMGRSAILGEQRNNYFCDVACGKAQCGDSTYAITRTGLLCEFNNRRLLDKWVELRTTSANCMAVGEQYIFVGCADGIVRCFDPSTLHFVTTLPRTHYLGVDVCQGLSKSHMSTHPGNAKYPDAIAVTFDEINNKLTVIYNDHSLYVWAVRDIKRVGKSHSFLYHSACIWGVEMAPRESPMPAGSFLTCSSDDTIRVWSLDKIPEQGKTMYQKNIYSNELLKVVYVDQDLAYLKDLDLSATTASNDKTDTTYDSRNGVRSIRLSPDGKHLASGDRAGNIRIHETLAMKEVCKVEAHDAEVLCLEYSNWDTQHKFLASASRDRLIHVFDVNQDYNFLQTLDDHSSSITAVRFLHSQGNLQMVSCGADKSIIFRQLTESQGDHQFSRGNNAAGKATLYDMEVDASQKYVLTACQDRNIRIYNVNSGKHSKTFKGSTGDDGSLIKVVLDRSGIYIATSCTDKTLSVYDYYSGECMATMCGHSELATGLRFTNDCRRLISASGDGCIFVWRVPHDMVVTMQARLSQQAMRQGKTLDNEIFSDGGSEAFDPNANSVDPDYRFSVSALPLWAKKQISDETSPPVSLNRGVDFPKGRWAQRAEQSIGAKSGYADSVISFPSLQDRRVDSDGSKDSSVDSGTESRHYSEVRRDVTSSTKMSPGFAICPESYNELLESSNQTVTSHITLSRGEHRKALLTDDSALGSLRDPDLESTAHDGDIEDISDHESRLQPMYYPSQQDSASGSEFPVTAMDVDELRKSQRKAKRPNLPLVSVTTASVSGSQDSEDDDDEASTPSGENTDRNPMSMFSVSSESLDQIVNREKYLQSTFESLSGTEMETSIGKTSISSQHHNRHSGGPVQLRNVAVINAAKQIKSDPEATKKREELNKRIEETRRKLQSVGYRSNLKSSQSISDLSHVPEKDNWFQPNRFQTQGISNASVSNVPSYYVPVNMNQIPSINCSFYDTPERTNNFPTSSSVPSDLQLCGCYLKDIVRNTTSYQPESPTMLSVDAAKIERPRRLKLAEKSKYKMHKSLPVSPVSEECRFSDFALSNPTVTIKTQPRRSFSYFVDVDDLQSTEDGLRQVCYDIQKFSQEYNQRDDYEEVLSGYVDRRPQIPPKPHVSTYKEVTAKVDSDDEDGNFSSDSLEDTSFGSTRIKKSKKYSMPRRCYSNNEIYNQDSYDNFACDPIPKSKTSFYLNQSNRNSQDSILSDDYKNSKSYCNSMESILSDDSECKSAPLEVLFAGQRKPKTEGIYGECSTEQNSPLRHINKYIYGDGSLPKNYSDYDENIENRYSNCSSPSRVDINRSKSLGMDVLKDINYSSEENIAPTMRVIKKSNTSYDFQQKLLKFEMAQTEERPKENCKKGIAYFIEAPKPDSMDIPSLKSKNLQYKSKYCNVLNNRPEVRPEKLFGEGSRVSAVQLKIPSFQSKDTKASTLDFMKENKKEKLLETTSLDRHILSKTLWESEKIAHKPPKPIRRNSSKNYSRNRNRKPNNLTVVENKGGKNPVTFDRNLTNTKNIDTDFDESNERVIEFSYKEKNKEIDCEANNKAILSDIYDSLDKLISDTNVDSDAPDERYDYWTKSKSVIESEHRNVWKKYDDFDKVNVEKSHTLKTSNAPLRSDLDIIQNSIENIKILHEIQQKVHKINVLVDAYRENMTEGKVRALSKMYETLSRSQIGLNNLSEFAKHAVKYKKRNLSLPNFVERNFSFTAEVAERRSRYEDAQTKPLDLSGIISDSNAGINMTVNANVKHLPTKNNVNIKLNSDLSSTKLNVDGRSLSNRSVEDRHNYKCYVSTVKAKCVDAKKFAESKSDRLTKSISAKLKGFTLLPSKSEAQNNMQDTESGLRRACSLSDLSVPGIQKPKIQVSGKLNKPTVAARTTVRTTKMNTMTRSSSTGVLNQSDSDPETSKANTRNSLMRPTISSQNKVSNAKSNTNRRRIAQSVSTINLSTVGQEDSSSEETSPIPSGKPVVPPRPRSLAVDHNQQPIIIPRRHAPGQKDKLKLNRHSTALEFTKDVDVNVKTSQVSTQLCKDVADQLTKAADNVVELYRRLGNVSDTNNDIINSNVQRPNLMKILEASVAKTQAALQDVGAQNAKQNGACACTTNGNHETDTMQKLNDLVAGNGGGEQTNVINIMQQYSDILLNIMQQRMANTNK